MLPCGNIRHTLEEVGIMDKEVRTKYLAYTEQLLCVDGWLVVKPLECAAVDVQLVGEPLVSAALAAQFVADKVAYVYLHITICFGTQASHLRKLKYRKRDACVPCWLPNPYKYYDDRRQKRRRAISSPV